MQKIGPRWVLSARREPANCEGEGNCAVLRLVTWTAIQVGSGLDAGQGPALRAVSYNQSL